MLSSWTYTSCSPRTEWDLEYSCFLVKKSKVKTVLLHAQLRILILWTMSWVRYRIPYEERAFFLGCSRWGDFRDTDLSWCTLTSPQASCRHSWNGSGNSPTIQVVLEVPQIGSSCSSYYISFLLSSCIF